MHLKVLFKSGSAKAPAYATTSGTEIVGPVNNFGYSCLRQTRCRVNNAETEAASVVNLAYAFFADTLLTESDPWQEKSTLKRQGSYRDAAGQMELWGGDSGKNAPGILRQMSVVNSTGLYEFNVCPIPCNFCRVGQNVPPNTKVEFDFEFNEAKFCLMARVYKADGAGGPPTATPSFKIQVDKSFLRVFYRVPVNDLLKLMETQVQATTPVNPMVFPFRRMRCENLYIRADSTSVDLNDVFRGRSPRLFWFALVTDKAYQGDYAANPFNFARNKLTSIACTANGVTVPRASLDTTQKYEIYDMLMNASGRRKRDAYLLDPDKFDEGFFLVPFDLTAVQDGGESSTPLLRLLVNLRLVFESGQSDTLQALFFYQTDESLQEIDNRGTIQGPIQLGDLTTSQ